MIKFFRRIRQNLLSENKFSKYLIYAIGEIVLVVIGILIALQINNWNEKRILFKKETVLKNSIIEELKTARIQLQENLQPNIEILDDISTFLDYKNSDSLYQFVNPIILLAHNPAKVEIPNIDNLLSSSENSPISNMESFQKLRELKIYYRKISLNDNYMDEFWSFQASQFLIKQNLAYESIQEFRKNKTASIDFKKIYSNQEFKNLLSVKWILQDQWINSQKAALQKTEAILVYFENLTSTLNKNNI